MLSSMMNNYNSRLNNYLIQSFKIRDFYGTYCDRKTEQKHKSQNHNYAMDEDDDYKKKK